jgi:hypothetical protein
VIARLIIPPHSGVVFYCTGRGTHDPVIVGDMGLFGEVTWTPAPRPAPGLEYRCSECRRSWRLGARRARSLVEAVSGGALAGEVDISNPLTL